MSDLHIPTPCHESWDGMTPAANGRHCATCNHAVVDIASMPVAQGRRALHEIAASAASGGPRTCVRAHTTPAGRLVAGRRKLLTTALAGILACSIAGCGGDGPDLVKPQPPSHQPTTGHDMPMGGVTAPNPGEDSRKGEVYVPPVHGQNRTTPTTGNPPETPPLTGSPVPRPKGPADTVVVGMIDVDDAPPAPPIPEPVKGKVAAP